MSLLEYTENEMDLEKVLDMKNNEIDSLYYLAQEVETSSPPSKDDNVKPKTITFRKELSGGSNRLLKILTSFHKHFRANEMDIFLTGVI